MFKLYSKKAAEESKKEWAFRAMEFSYELGFQLVDAETGEFICHAFRVDSDGITLYTSVQGCLQECGYETKSISFDRLGKIKIQ